MFVSVCIDPKLLVIKGGLAERGGGGGGSNFKKIKSQTSEAA